MIGINPTTKHYAAFGYLMTTLDRVEFYGVTPVDELMCYKGLIFTPVGALRFDTGHREIHECACSITQARQWLNRWSDSPRPYIRLTAQELINNWQKHGLWEGRQLENLIIRRWDRTGDAMQIGGYEGRMSEYLPTKLSFKINEVRQSI